ncbi:MAG: hypothetical protein HY243_15780 [Proteobacteria bacterium]|nr:hypothetical protein [Pseudomonadota bacterium]
MASAPAAADLRPLCPDRPGKGTSACTGDEGYFQIESDVFNETIERSGGINFGINAATPRSQIYVGVSWRV